MFELILLAIILLGAFLSAPFIIKNLAAENIVFTTVKEGTAKAIVRGESFERFIMTYQGYHLNDPSKVWYDSSEPKWMVLPNKQPDLYYDERSSSLFGWILLSLGVYYIGLPWSKDVFYYTFEWNEVETDPSTGKQRVRRRKEVTDFIYVVHFTYAVVTDRAETSDRLQTDWMTLLTMQVVNPFKAIFETEDWMQRVTAKVNGYIASFAGKQKYDDLVTFCKASDASPFSKPLIALTEDSGTDSGLRSEYGVEIEAAEQQTMDLSGERGSALQEAASKSYVAEQTKIARIKEAEGEAEAKKTVGAAEAHVIEIKGEAEAKALQKRMAEIGKDKEIGVPLAGFDAARSAVVEAAKALAGGK